MLKLLDKEAIKVVNPCPDQFVSRIFLVPQKEPVINLKPLNQFMATSHFQDGESGHAEESSETRRLNGFERCLPVGGNLGGALGISAVCMKQ